MEPLEDELEALLAEEMEGGGEEAEGGHKRRLDLASRADAARSLAGARRAPAQCCHQCSKCSALSLPAVAGV